jgi:hypothetical protein
MLILLSFCADLIKRKTMKLKLIVCLLILVGLVIGGLLFVKRTPSVARVETHGDVFNVSVFEFGTPLKFNTLYEPRDDLNDYSWLKTFLFLANDYSAYVPESDWHIYWPRSWTADEIQGQKSANESRRTFALEDENNYYSTHHAEINKLIVCEHEMIGRFLDIPVGTAETATGIQDEDVVWMNLINENGHWVFGTPKGLSGRDYADILEDCRREVLEMIDNGSVRTRNVRWMKK